MFPAKGAAGIGVRVVKSVLGNLGIQVWEMGRDWTSQGRGKEHGRMELMVTRRWVCPAVTLTLGTLPGSVSCCNMSVFPLPRNIPKQAFCSLVFYNMEDGAM